MLKALNKIMMVVYDILENVAAVFLTAVIIVVLCGIVSRYIFNSPFIWTEEVCTLLMVNLAYTSATMATVRKGHLVADFITGAFPGKFAWWHRLVVWCVTIFFLGFLLFSILKLMPNVKMLSAALRIPRQVFYFPCMLGSFGMLFFNVIHILNHLFPGNDLFAQRAEARYQEEQRAEREDTSALTQIMDEFQKKIDEDKKEDLS